MARRRKRRVPAGHENVRIWTDGACIRNPGGPGGFAALILERGKSERIISGAERKTTNNRMELMAAIVGLEALEPRSIVRVYSDSKYVINGITRWIPAWRERGWKTVAGTPVRNQEIWERLVSATAPHLVLWSWVKGHSGIAENERVDLLAKNAMRRVMDV